MARPRHRGSKSATYLEPHTERLELAQHRRVLFGRNGRLAADPVENVVVALRQQPFVLVELGGPEFGDMGARELAEKDVVLLVATVDTAIEQTLTPRLEIQLARHVFPRKRRSI